MKKIGKYTFSGCRGLTGELKIPGSVKEIGAYAFFYCSGLTGELKIPDSVKEIGRSAFGGCIGLTRIRVPKGVEIDTCAFPSGVEIEKY